MCTVCIHVGGHPVPQGRRPGPATPHTYPPWGCSARGLRLQEGGRPGQGRPGQRQLRWRKSGSRLPLRAWGISPRPTVLEKGRPRRPGRWVGPGGDLDSNRKPSPGRQGHHQGHQWKPSKSQEKSPSLNFLSFPDGDGTKQEPENVSGLCGALDTSPKGNTWQAWSCPSAAPASMFTAPKAWPRCCQASWSPSHRRGQGSAALLQAWAGGILAPDWAHARPLASWGGADPFQTPGA